MIYCTTSEYLKGVKKKIKELEKELEYYRKELEIYTKLNFYQFSFCNHITNISERVPRTVIAQFYIICRNTAILFRALGIRNKFNTVLW